MAVPSAFMMEAMKKGAKFSEVRTVFPESMVILQGVIAEEQTAIDRAQDLIAIGLMYEKWISQPSRVLP